MAQSKENPPESNKKAPENRRAKEKERIKPGKEALKKQEDQAAQILERDMEEEKAKLEKILVDEGPEIKPEDFEELYETIPEIFSEACPEFSNYLKGLSPRLAVIMDETSKLKNEKLDQEALEKFNEFLNDEIHEARKIKNPKLQEILLTHIGMVLNIDKIEKDVDAQKRLKYLSEGADCIPGLGTLKMTKETWDGQTMIGEKLTGIGRAIHGGCAIAGLVSDAFTVVTAVETFGAGAVVSEAAKIAAFQIAKKTSQKLVKSGAKTAVKSYLKSDIKETVEKFSALCHKSPQLKKSSETMYKTGHLMQKYPQILEAVEHYCKIRNQGDRLAQKR